jgi:hypothetical protein
MTLHRKTCCSIANREHTCVLPMGVTKMGPGELLHIFQEKSSPRESKYFVNGHKRDSLIPRNKQAIGKSTFWLDLLSKKPPHE